MAESIAGSFKEPPKYENQPTPYLRNKQDRENWRAIEIRNRQQQRALDDLRREPPSVFHAPNGYESLKHGTEMQKDRVGRKKDEMPGTRGYVEPAAWPPTAADHSSINRARVQYEVDTENTRIQKKLQDIYRSKHFSMFAKRSELGGQPMDCTDRWAMRTSLYQPDAGQPSSSGHNISHATPATSYRPRPASAPKQRPRPGSASANLNVPKTIGVASCAGCGTKSFHSADGPGLTACGQCKQVFYCSETCAKTDFQSHKAMCKFYTTGVWQPYGQRPADDYWVNNSAMAKARKALKTRQSANQRLAPEDELEEQAKLEEIVKKERERERKADAKQRHIEWRATWGLDGPRPCMYMGGKRV